jgi:hypothetical protein
VLGSRAEPLRPARTTAERASEQPSAQLLRCVYSQKAASDTAKTAKSATVSIRNFLKEAIVLSACVAVVVSVARLTALWGAED